VLKGLDDYERCQIHINAKGLFTETTVCNEIVVGSRKNNLGEALLRKLNREAGFSLPQTYRPQVSNIQNQDGAENPVDDGPWDITGTWELECPGIVDCFSQFSPYTLEIFTSLDDGIQETYGRFDLGEYEGLF